MPKINYISIRRNPSGSCKMRTLINLNPVMCGVRMNFGLMTKDLNLAMLRAKMLWHALRQSGFIQTEKVVCGCKGNSEEIHQILKSREAASRDMARVDRYYMENEQPMTKSSTAKNLVFSAKKNKELVSHFTLVSNTAPDSRFLDIALRTSNFIEATYRGCILYRAFCRILSHEALSATCLHGKVIQPGNKTQARTLPKWMLDE